MRRPWLEARCLPLMAALAFVCMQSATGPGVADPRKPQPAEETASSPEIEKVRGLLHDGRYGEAASLARELLQSTEAAKGPDSVETAGVLDLLVDALVRGGKAREPESRRLAERAVAIKEKALGADHLDVAASLNMLAVLKRRSGDYAAARALHERTLAIREKALGPDHLHVAWSLNNLALLLYDMGEYEAARPFCERALAVKEKALGPDDPGVATTLNNLGLLLKATGEYAKARTAYERALAIRERALGPDHPHVATTLGNLALLMSSSGDYAGAKPLAERALALEEKNFGPENSRVAMSLNNLANLMTNMGDYAGARRLHERALAIREKVLGPDHPLVASSLNNLAVLMDDMGDLAAARPLYERALAVLERSLGPDHPRVATALSNLAGVTYSAGDDAGARPLFERALAIREKALGPDHPEVAFTMHALAELMTAVGDLAGARPLYERALAVLEKSLGPDHLRVAGCLDGFAALLVQMGDDAGAKALFERAVGIREKALGPTHPAVAALRSRLAEHLSQTGEGARALDLALRAEDAGREHLRLTARTLPERQALAYAAKRASGLDVALSLAARGGLPEGSRGRAWDALVKSRALVLDEMASRNRVTAEARRIAEYANRLARSSQQLANLMMRGPGTLPPDQYRRLLDEAQQEKEKAERALAEKSLQFRDGLAKSRLGLADVAAALPSRSALVAYAKFSQYAPAPESTAAPGKAEDATQSEASSMETVAVPFYLAFVLREGQREPAVVAIGTAKAVETLVSRWSEEAGQKGREAGRPRAEAACRAAGDALRRMVWDPVAAMLKSEQRVFVVPDGALNLVNLSSFPSGKDRYLIETGPLFHYLSAERDLVQPTSHDLEGSGLLAFGGIAFDETSLFASLAAKEKRAEEGTPGAGIVTKLAAYLPFRGERSGCGGFQSLRFDSLPASVREVSEVAALWKEAKGKSRMASLETRDNTDDVLKLTGAQGSETAFKELAPGRSVLHLATHGFFLGGSCTSALARGRGIVGPAAEEEPSPAAIAVENPLLLSGLVLAGANHRQDAGPNEDDGILTAEEIGSLDLSGVEWAVLSACDTGIGEVKAGEGVFGLRRAFDVAGVRSLIMSLWPVDDEAARLWMRRLYEARLLKGMDTAESVREASLSLLKERRAKGESTHPFYWAGFVAAGDWR